MTGTIKQDKKSKLLVVSFILTLLYSLHFAITIYINSTYISELINKNYVSILYIIAYSFTFAISIYLAKYIRIFHTYKSSIFIILCALLSTLLVVFSENKLIGLIGVVLHLIFSSLIGILINIFIEEYSNTKSKGMVRGIFLTLLNTGILISPLIAGQILNVTNYNFKSIYLISALMLIPMLVLIKEFYKNTKDPIFREVDIVKSIKNIMIDKNISGIMLAMLLLECFYALMVIYMPMYISSYTNLKIEDYVGTILPFALIPFVLLPYETGILADKKLGEKELLFTGLFILIISLIFISNSISSNLIYWAILLAFSRTGASLIETMSFTYFFKKVDRHDISTITLFGNLRVLSYILTGIISWVIFYTTQDIRIIFYFFIIILIISLYKIYKIKDTL